MDYRDIIESRYDRKAWQELLHDIFRSKVSFWREPSAVHASSRLAKTALNLGKISLADGESIAIYEIELTDNVDIERNRRGIRDMLTSDWRNMGYAGAFMFCYRQNESVLRFSYVSESWSFADDGTYKKDSTDTRRFTYLLGEGHRSRTAIQQFEGLKKSNLSLKDLTKAFSVDAVSDMFFDDYKQQYEDIIAFITGKRMVKVSNKWEERVVGEPNETIFSEFRVFADPEKAIRDYVKKLMGRLVFLQFLQKKGWLGVPVNAKWGDGDREFIQHLFENVADKDTFVDNVLEPLFNDINSEREGDIASSAVGKGIRVPYLNGGLFEPDAADAVDFPLPAKYMKAMLDFFASYNFTIDENDPDDAEMGVDPEMLGRIFENLLEDNKDKGAFYTPKEIVGYMCRESLIAYLQTDIEKEEQKEAIRQFVTTHQFVEHLPSDTLEMLKNVKICDPAIGSGAFPMGLLKELYLCRAALEGFDQKKAAEIKKHIIQQNIYGVDIERGAVDTARLRFWLALIVDEESPEALPNLDFKIMQGNSLLEQYKGVNLESVIEKKVDSSGMLSLYDDMLDVYRKELREMLTQYFNCADQDKKMQLRDNIVANVKKQFDEQGIDCDFGELNIAENDQFFMWHTWFYDVFSKGGFDIVIGNPPYVARIDENLKSILGSLYPNAKKKIFDLYNFFMAFSLSILAKKRGVSCMIVPPTWLNNKNSFKLRIELANNGLFKVDYLNDTIFNNAIVYSCIYFTAHQQSINVECGIGNIVGGQLVVTQTNLIKRGAVLASGDVLPLYPSKGILPKVLKLNGVKLLGDISNIVFGIQERKSSKDQSYTHDSKVNDMCVKVLNGKHIEKYHIKESGLYLEYGPWLWNPRKREVFETKEKIIVRQVGKFPICAYDDKQFFTLNTIYNIIVKDTDVCTKYVLAILNSKFMEYLWGEIYTEKKDVFPRLKKEQLVEIPIIVADKEMQDVIAHFVDAIISEKSLEIDVSTSVIENSINKLVYHLYNLTYDEVLIVDPETPITREEYDQTN